MLRILAIACLLVHFAVVASEARGQAGKWSIETAPPIVVKTVPESGASDVNPRLKEIRITFSKTMLDKSWTWVKTSDDEYPETTGKPYYLGDRRTCVLPVELKPGTTYVLWINDPEHQGFKDSRSTPAVPYPLIFKTTSSPPESSPRL